VVGIEQMKKLEWRVCRKKEMFALYQHELSELLSVSFIETDLDSTSPWFIDILVDNRDDLQTSLREAGIGSRPVYPPVHTQSPYSMRASYPVSERVSAQGLWLPSSSFLGDNDILRICKAIKNHFNTGS